MTFLDWLTVAAIAICLVVSAFFSASETALTASSRAAMMRLEKHGNPDATIVNRLLATRERLLGAVLFANNVPKTAASNAPDRMALAVARPIERTVSWFLPVLKAVEWLVRIILRGIGVPVGKIQSILSPREELRGAVDLMHRAGVVEKLDRDMMGGLLDLRELTVSDVMIHRTKMVMLDADEPPREIVEAVLAPGITRLPLWRGSPDNVIGVLHAKEGWRALHAAGGAAGQSDPPPPLQ